VGYLTSILLGALQQGPLEARLSRLEATLGLESRVKNEGPDTLRVQRLEKRIERAEQAAKEKSKHSAECICFPENEPPFFAFEIELELHGLRVFLLICGRPKRRRLTMDELFFD
jgi:hypothetical protein